MWTGDANGECETLKETGIIGSLRWWYEAIVRGLGGYACDPTSSGKCELNYGKFSEALNKGKSIQEALDEQICPACQLFGCTGWSKKFKTRILIEKDFNSFNGFEGVFKINLIELKDIRNEERLILKRMFQIIGRYGSIGGRTTRKPQKKGNIGKDYGLISLKHIGIETKATNGEVDFWISKNKENLLKVNDEEWPNLKYFFFIKNRFLWRNQINVLMGNIPFLKGEPNGKFGGRSKRIFSFRSNGGRIWGYVNKTSLENVERNFDQMGISKVFWGKDVLK